METSWLNYKSKDSQKINKKATKLLSMFWLDALALLRVIMTDTQESSQIYVGYIHTMYMQVLTVVWAWCVKSSLILLPCKNVAKQHLHLINTCINGHPWLHHLILKKAQWKKCMEMLMTSYSLKSGTRTCGHTTLVQSTIKLFPQSHASASHAHI